MQVVQNNRCTIHCNYDLQFVSMNQNASQQLLCSVCLLKQQKVDSYLYIQDIIHQEDHLPIQNWPKGITNNQLDYLSTHSRTNKQQVIKNQIVAYYENLSDKISQAIKQSQQLELNKIEEFDIGKNQLIEYYNQQFQRNELKKYFSNCESLNSSKLNEFLGKIDVKRESQLQQLQLMINKFDEVDNHIFFEQAKYIERIICDLIKNINFFSLEIQKIDQKKLDQKNQSQYQQEINNLEKKYIDLIQNMNEAQKQYNAYLKSVNSCEWDSNQIQDVMQDKVNVIGIKVTEQKIDQKKQDTKKFRDNNDGWNVAKYQTEEKMLKLKQFNDKSSQQSDNDSQKQNSFYKSQRDSSSDSVDSNEFCERFKKAHNINDQQPKIQRNIQKK